MDSIKETRVVEIPSRLLKEEIMSVFHQLGKFVLVSIQEYHLDGEKGNINKTIEISDDYYKELMSQSPDWAKDKPEGTFRMSDIWNIIDKIKKENTV